MYDHIFQPIDVGPITIPVGGAEHRSPFVGYKFLRQVEFIGFLVQFVSEPSKDTTHLLEDRIGLYTFLAD